MRPAAMWALHAAGITTKKAATDTMVTGAAVGTAVAQPRARRSAPPWQSAIGAAAGAGVGSRRHSGRRRLRRRQRHSVQRATTSATCSDVFQGQQIPVSRGGGAVLPSGGDEHGRLLRHRRRL